MDKLTGLIAAPFTPLDNNYNLDLSRITEITSLYDRNDVQGAFICGTTGEGASISHEEKKALIVAWSEDTGSLKKIFMLGGTCLPEIQELGALAQAKGLDGISIYNPYFFIPPSVTGLVSYCKKVAASAPDLPFYYYHIPSLTRGNFSMFEFLQQADGVIPNLAGIKYSDSNLFDFQACVNFNERKYNMLWGVDEALLSGMVAGADGAVGSTYNYAAPLYNKILKAFDKRNLDEAKELQLQAVKMVQLLVKFGGIGAGKAFMKIIGIDCGWFRPPIQTPTDDDVHNLRVALKEIGFFEFCSR
jgi:N-acetylneuraminate lyase